jgi:hypothetical protein
MEWINWGIKLKLVLNKQISKWIIMDRLNILWLINIRWRSKSSGNRWSLGWYQLGRLIK